MIDDDEEEERFIADTTKATTKRFSPKVKNEKVQVGSIRDEYCAKEKVETFQTVLNKRRAYGCYISNISQGGQVLAIDVVERRTGSTAAAARIRFLVANTTVSKEQERVAIVVLQPFRFPIPPRKSFSIRGALDSISQTKGEFSLLEYRRQAQSRFAFRKSSSRLCNIVP